MSNPESFIDEVNEEVRRDRLYGLMRRWGWLAVLAVLLLVGGAAWTEWRSARERVAAQAFGDAVLAASAIADPAARAAAIASLEPLLPGQAELLALLEAGTLADVDGAAARARLLALAEAEGTEPLYRDLALMKAMLSGGTGDPARDGAILEALASPGAPFRGLALEAQALRALEAGDEATAVTLLRLLSEEAGATDTLRRRAVQTMVALGAAPEPA